MLNRALNNFYFHITLPAWVFKYLLCSCVIWVCYMQVENTNEPIIVVMICDVLSVSVKRMSRNLSRRVTPCDVSHV